MNSVKLVRQPNPSSIHGHRLRCAAAVALGIAILSTAAAQPLATPSVSDEPGLSKLDEADIRSATFQGVSPGKSTRSQTIEALGNPVEGDPTDGVLVYRTGPFSRVDVVLADDIVQSIILNLAEPATPEAIVQDLQLSRFRSVEVLDENGQPLGQAFPERGLLFTYVANSRAVKVDHIVLESITAEAFLLRAERDQLARFSAGLADVEYAQVLEPGAARGYWLRARILHRLGRLEEAETHAARAVEIEARPEYEITWQWIRAQRGQAESAAGKLQRLLESDNLEPAIAAQGHLALGQVLHWLPEPDDARSIEHQVQALRLAEPLTADPATRRAAAELLFETHLSIANTVATGAFKKRGEVIPQWLEGAEQVLRENPSLLNKDLREQQLRCRRLITMAQSSVEFQPASLAESAIQSGRRLIADQEDALRQEYLQWQLGEALYYAARVDQTAGRYEASMKWANNAHSLLHDTAPSRDNTDQVQYTLGGLEFLIGALYAVDLNDHEQAVTRYLKALDQFPDSLPPTARLEIGIHGERMVSMGVSFWTVGQKEKGIELTEQGAALMQQAVNYGLLDQQSLSVPYGNLSSMATELGDDEKAKAYSQKAASSGEPAKRSIR